MRIQQQSKAEPFLGSAFLCTQKTNKVRYNMNTLKMFGSMVINVAEAIATTPIVIAETLCLVGRDVSFATAKAAVWSGGQCESGRVVCSAAKVAIHDQAVIARVKHHIKTARSVEELTAVFGADAIEPDLYKEKLDSLRVSESEAPEPEFPVPEGFTPLEPAPPITPMEPRYVNINPEDVSEGLKGNSGSTLTPEPTPRPTPSPAPYVSKAPAQGPSVLV